PAPAPELACPRPAGPAPARRPIRRKQRARAARTRFPTSPRIARSLIDHHLMRAIVGEKQASRRIEREGRPVAKSGFPALRRLQRREQLAVVRKDIYSRLLAIERVDVAQRIDGEIDDVAELIAIAARRNATHDRALSIEEHHRLRVPVESEYLVA